MHTEFRITEQNTLPERKSKVLYQVTISEISDQMDPAFGETYFIYGDELAQLEYIHSFYQMRPDKTHIEYWFACRATGEGNEIPRLLSISIDNISQISAAEIRDLGPSLAYDIVRKKAHARSE